MVSYKFRIKYRGDSLKYYWIHIYPIKNSYFLNIAHMSNNDQIKNKYTSYKMALIFLHDHMVYLRRCLLQCNYFISSVMFITQHEWMLLVSSPNLATCDHHYCFKYFFPYFSVHLCLQLSHTYLWSRLILF